MKTLRKHNQRGRGDHGWLDSQHTFSFAGYMDPDHMGFRTLRVMNEDKVKPAKGFGTHPHQNMEIFSYVVDGKLAHKDSTGHEAVIGPGTIQFMSAGSGVTHSEFNGSESEDVHFYQIWVIPAQNGTQPRYQDKDFTEKLQGGDLVLFLSPDGTDGSIKIGQDARVYGARPRKGSVINHTTDTSRGVWLQAVRGALKVDDVELKPGDGLAIEKTAEFTIEALEDSELLLLDLK